MAKFLQFRLVIPRHDVSKSYRDRVDRFRAGAIAGQVLDEGVRCEARQGGVLAERTTSYIFTLLEERGIWLDAATFGNLSRYINHSSEYPSITPKITYVNHDYRI